mgnify:CR=1 FL=1
MQLSNVASGKVDAESFVELPAEPMMSHAIRAAKVMGVRDYARVDMRIDAATGEAFILEVNPNPDLAEHGAFMQCAIAGGRTFTQTIQTIVDLALARAHPP